ncbi:MAG: hypothetical protein ACK55Z_06355, partial [bacterium]
VMQGGSKICDKTFSVPEDIKRIEVMFHNEENFMEYISFTATDGSVTQIGEQKSQHKSGRVEAFDL